MDGLRNLGALVGRILLVVIFLLSGFGKLTGPAGTMKMMAAHGIPIVHVALVVTILIELGCGILVVIGYQARWAALLVFLWFIPVTLIFHVAGYREAILNHQVQAAIIQQTMYLKNISILGGLLMLVAHGPGGWSIDGMRSHSLESATRRAA
ncbi:MAG: DoxX family protein [Candidatus Binataceae bacterium]